MIPVIGYKGQKVAVLGLGRSGLAAAAALTAGGAEPLLWDDAPEARAGVIDYSRHALKSARMDVILCAKCRFFLGCTSGLSLVASVFGRPVAQTNMIPLETLGIGQNDLSIPKLLWSVSDRRHLKFPEIFMSKASGYFFSHQYADANLRVDDNSEAEIVGLAIEMIERLDAVFLASEEGQQRHAKYMSLFRPGHYSYGAVSRVGTRFLQQHRDLLA